MDDRNFTGELPESDELRELWHLAVQVARAQGSPDPEAVAQEVLLRVTRQREWPKHPRAWVRRAAENQKNDDWRKVEWRPQQTGVGGRRHRLTGRRR